MNPSVNVLRLAVFLIISLALLWLLFWIIDGFAIRITTLKPFWVGITFVCIVAALKPLNIYFGFAVDYISKINPLKKVGRISAICVATLFLLWNTYELYFIYREGMPLMPVCVILALDIFITVVFCQNASNDD